MPPRTERAANTLVGSFVNRVRSDLAAVQSAVSSQWSNNQTEGQVTRLRLVKRQIYLTGWLEMLARAMYGDEKNAGFLQPMRRKKFATGPKRFSVIDLPNIQPIATGLSMNGGRKATRRTLRPPISALRSQQICCRGLWHAFC